MERGSKNSGFYNQLSLASYLLLKSYVKKALFVFSITISLSFAANSASNAAGKCADFGKPAILQGFANKHYVGSLKEAKKPIDGKTHLLELYPEHLGPALSMGQKKNVIPAIRKRLNPENFIELQYGNGNQAVILVLKNNVELYLPGRKPGRLHLVKSVAAKGIIKAYSSNNNMYLLTKHSIIIAGKNQSPLIVPLNANLLLRSELTRAKKIIGFSHKVDSDLSVVVEYIPESAKMNQVQLGFFDRFTGEFITKPASEIIDVAKDSIELSKQNGHSESTFTIESVKLKLPLVYTGSTEHSSTHHTFMRYYDFRIDVLTYGYSQIIQNIFDAVYLKR